MNQHYSFENDENLETLTAFAFEELKHQRNVNDIIQRLCERTGWRWQEAQQFLESIRVDKRSQLEAHKNRSYIPVSLVMIVGGMLNIAIFYFWAFYNPRNGEFLFPNDMKSGIMFWFQQFFWLFAKFPVAYFFYSLVLVGIGMIIGGVIGIVTSFWRILKHKVSFR